ncbi:hypothetical protein GGX14DRAFT_558948 [Mycena pura]|uniref:Uncharacterized protein n=1 Tax=Mycena pura TaxID=153505 RepID=A0AAD6VVA3_9AGAR|nr:hypothetical protein GGX14DRAFT_558948 [Mycena pura]
MTTSNRKQPKRFLDQSATRVLAESIADIQEQKAQKNVEKAQIAQPPPRVTPRFSASKVRLKETKARLAVLQYESKKARKRHRKQLQQSSLPANGDGAPSAPPVKKRVSFA